MLSSVEDPRSRFGLRHSLQDMLLMSIMTLMSGSTGYREMGRFLDRNRKEFQQSLRLLHKVPSYATISTLFGAIDCDELTASFNRWASQYVPMCKGNTKAVDGKAIAGTVSNSSDAFQNFVSLVGVFAVERGIVLSCNRIENGKQSEIPTVHELILALDVKGELFTLDALHCQKKH